MATTAQQLINRAMELCGHLGSARTPGASESGDALLFLNTLMDSFNAQRCYVCGLDTVTVAVTSGTRLYALGTRPIHIERAEFHVSAGGITMPLALKVMGADEFNAIPRQGNVTPFPKGIYCDYGFPTASVAIAPLPGTGSLKLYTWQLVSQFAALSDTVTVPPGILRALQYALAIELCPVFEKVPTPGLIAAAANAKGAMESLNLSHVYGVPATPEVKAA